MSRGHGAGARRDPDRQDFHIAEAAYAASANEEPSPWGPLEMAQSHSKAQSHTEADGRHRGRFPQAGRQQSGTTFPQVALVAR